MSKQKIRNRNPDSRVWNAKMFSIILWRRKTYLNLFSYKCWLLFIHPTKFEHWQILTTSQVCSHLLFSFFFKCQPSKIKSSKTKNSAISWLHGMFCVLCTFRICPAFIRSQDMNMLLGEMINCVRSHAVVSTQNWPFLMEML